MFKNITSVIEIYRELVYGLVNQGFFDQVMNSCYQIKQNIQKNKMEPHVKMRLRMRLYKLNAKLATLTQAFHSG